jgi:uncharacterized membrane protein
VEDQVRVSPSISVIAFMLGVSLILVGLLLVIMGAISIPGDATKAEAGGLVMIGPIPIFFHGRLSPLIILVILVAMILVFLLPILYLLRSERERGVERDEYN